MSTQSRANKPQQGVRASTSFAIAIGLHVVLVLAIPEFRQTLREIADSTADLIEVEAEPVPPEPEVAPEPEAPRPRAEPVAPRENTPPPPQAAAAEPPPQAAEVVEMPELVMGNGVGGFTMTQGTGTPTEPIRAGVPTGRDVEGSPDGVLGGDPNGHGDAIVPVSDLSERGHPTAELDSILRRLYPSTARQQGVEGRAVVAVEVRADGSLGRIRAIRQTPAGFGFGEACVATVREGGNWTSPRDRDGRAVRSVINFSCNFSVDG